MDNRAKYEKLVMMLKNRQTLSAIISGAISLLTFALFFLPLLSSTRTTINGSNEPVTVTIWHTGIDLLSSPAETRILFILVLLFSAVSIFLAIYQMLKQKKIKDFGILMSFAKAGLIMLFVFKYSAWGWILLSLLVIDAAQSLILEPKMSGPQSRRPYLLAFASGILFPMVASVLVLLGM